MFAVIAGEGSRQPDDIAAMALRLAGDEAPMKWVDESGFCSVAARPMNMLPEDLFDTQPFVDADLAFVCRARLDTRAELLTELHIDPVRGAAMSDGNILRHAYKKWGDETPRHIYGDFAFAAWERRAMRLVVATDHIGTSPLFYTRQGPRILIATQLSALMAHPAIEPRLDLRALGLMAASKLGRGWTMFEDLHHLPGSEVLTFQHGTVSTTRWWRPDSTPRIFHSKDRDYVEEVRPIFNAAVAGRLRTRGNIVATLSGGLDSTLVTATAALQLMGSGRTLDAFTSIPQPGMVVEERAGWDADDLPWARAVAEFHPSIRHHLVSPDGEIPLDILPAIHAGSCTSIRNTANLVWIGKISAWASHNGASVVLCGSNGNLSISYPGDDCDLSPLSMKRLAGIGRRIGDRIRDRDFRLHGGSSIRKDGTQLRPGSTVLRSDFCDAHYDDLLVAMPSASPREIFVHGLTSPLKAANPDLTAQFGVDWRDPTSDRRLLEHLLALPLHAFRAGGRSRGLARELGRGILPESVRLRRSRGSQTPDQAAWFHLREKEYRAALEAIQGSDSCRHFLDLPRLESMLDILCAGDGTMSQSIIAHRALDAGLFAVAFEAGIFNSSHNLLAACA